MGAQRFGGPLEEHAEDSRFKSMRKLLGPRSFWIQDSEENLLDPRPQALTREVWEEDLDPRSFPSES